MKRGHRGCIHYHIGARELSNYVCCDLNNIEPDVTTRPYLGGIDHSGAWVEQPRTLYREATGHTWIRTDAATDRACDYHTSTGRLRPRTVTTTRDHDSAAAQRQRRSRAHRFTGGEWVCLRGHRNSALTQRGTAREVCVQPECRARAMTEAHYGSRPGAVDGQPVGRGGGGAIRGDKSET
jgi:hypothetical protein